MEEVYGDLAEAGNKLPPLGLAQLAAITRKAGYETEILDCTALDLSYKKALEIIIKKNPDYIGMTSTTVYAHHTAKLAGMIKKANPKIKIILGGPHITAAPENTFNKYSQFDIGVLGEGDITIIELLKALDNKKSLDKVNGLLLRKKSKLKTTKSRPLLHDLDSLPIPAYDLLPDIKRYYQPPLNSLYRLPSASMVTSRGCPLRCTFCANVIHGRHMRAHSAEYVMKIIKQLYYKYNIKEIQFYEDNFAAYRDRLVKLCNLLIKENLDLKWSCMASVNVVNPEILRLMKRAGCWQIAYGCESGSQKILNEYKKGITTERIKKAITWTKQTGIRTKGFFMLANLLETIETLEETLKFVKSLPLDDFHITYFTPLPGSEAYANVKKYGVYNEDWSKMNMFDVSFIPYGLTPEILRHYYKRFYKEFYIRPRIILYFLNKLKQPAVRNRFIKSSFGFIKFILKPHAS